MSVAVLLGASSGIALELSRHILRNTSLSLVALSSRQPSHTKEAISSSLVGLNGLDDRLSVYQVDGLGDAESGLSKAADSVRARYGKDTVRLVVASAGILHPEKSLSQIDQNDALESFKLNTLSHLLTYKHFVPLIPTSKVLEKQLSAEAEDPAKGLISRDLSLCLSVSARVGSIADNRMGGWYSYRSSKSALNQSIATMNLELQQKRSSAISLAYHPGTTKTPLSSPFVSSSKPSSPSEGLFEPEEAVEKLVALMGRLKREEDGGGFRDWRGNKVPW